MDEDVTYLVDTGTSNEDEIIKSSTIKVTIIDDDDEVSIVSTPKDDDIVNNISINIIINTNNTIKYRSVYNPEKEDRKKAYRKLNEIFGG